MYSRVERTVTEKTKYIYDPETPSVSRSIPQIRNVTSINRHFSPNDLVVSDETRKIIEACDHNGQFDTGLLCVFPLTEDQYRKIEGRVGRTLSLAHIYTQDKWQVELQCMFDKNEWQGLMKYRPMAPVILNGEHMTQGCKIRILNRI